MKQTKTKREKHLEQEVMCLRDMLEQKEAAIMSLQGEVRDLSDSLTEASQTNQRLLSRISDSKVPVAC